MSVAAGKMAGTLRKPIADTGLWSWVTTVDHKRIGIMYLATGFLFFLVGGVEALLIRLQLARPENTLLTGDQYNQVMTMHGTTMLFFAAMPIIAAFFNYFMPILIGARDVAFPRLNALSYWLFLAGGVVLNSSWFLGGAPDSAWVNYPNVSGADYNSGIGIDFYLIGLQLAGIGTLIAAVNFTVTIINLRAPGMTLMRMPPFVWTAFFMSVIILFAFPPFTVAMLLLMFDRWFGTGFYVPAMGGDITLWQHLFWIFGHPEVYILVLPAFGIIAEVVPVFSRKPFFGYKSAVVAMSTITTLGFIVWVHHLYTIGQGPWVNSVFATTTKAISVPTGILVFNWIATMWGGRVRFTAPMLYAAGFLSVFVVGGLSGIVNATAPLNPQLHNTYWVVGHFHYVAIGGILFALLAGGAYWWSKITGRLLDDRLGRWSFWFTFIGFNATFFPMHLLGVLGMPRRIYTYSAQLGLGGWNMAATVGSLILGVGLLIYTYNVVRSLFAGERATADPWDGRSLEWSIPSPPPAYNFATIPQVQGRDAFWLAKRADKGWPEAAATGDHGGHSHAIHMPSPSYMPALIGLGVTIASYGALFRSLAVTLIGGAVTLLAIYGWIFEDDGGYLVEPEGDAR